MTEIAGAKAVQTRVLDVSGRVASVIAAVILIVGSVVYGEMAYGYGLLRKDWPDFSTFGLMRILVSFVVSAFLFLALRPAARTVVTPLPIAAFWGAATTICGLLIVVVLLVTVPKQLYGYVSETHLLGNLTELLLVGALVFLLFALVKARGSRWPRILGIGTPFLIVLGMAGIVFLILMEEISWGQHWLDFSTPELFEGNLQQETNLHNFYTYQFEAVYYTAAFACFVVLPWCWPRYPLPLLKPLTPYVPPAAFALFAVPVAVPMFEAWNIVPYQVWYFLGILICLDMSRRLEQPALRIMAGGVAMVQLVVLPIYLVLGHNMLDGYELSELREVFISLALMAYAWMLAQRLRQHGSEADFKPG